MGVTEESVSVPRWCYFIPLGQQVEGKGYIPSVVVEGEAGHSPLVGRGELSEPWYWGDFGTACRLAAEANCELGLTDEDVKAIVDSSIAESIRQGAVADEVQRKLQGRPWQ